MSWFDWLRQKAAKETSEPEHAQTRFAGTPLEEELPSMPQADGCEALSELAGLDFYSAIAAHQRWKNRLKSVVTGKSRETLDPALVGRCDSCALGQWLATQDGHASVPPELMDDLKRQHAAFHALAAEIIRLNDQGLHAQALEALRTDAPYNRTSHRVTQLLSRIHLELSEFQQPSTRS